MGDQINKKLVQDKTVLNKGAYWLIKAADKGNKTAQKELADSYLFGLNGLERNNVKADFWRKQYEKEPIVKKEIKMPQNPHPEKITVSQEKPIKKLSESTLVLFKSAETGIKESQFLIGEKYANGEELEKDYKTAFEWYLKAADNGLERAMVAVGICYKEGLGIKADEDVAFEWFNKAADLSYIPAYFEIGLCYFNGVSVMQNKRIAFEYINRALNAGYLRAITFLADCYLSGNGVPKDSLKAKELYETAALKSNPYALYKLGEMYAGNYLSVEKDEKKAATYYAKAASLGQEDAEYMLGYYYAYGQGGLKQNNNKAHDLFLRSAKKGNKFAISGLKKLFNEEVTK